MRSRRAPKPVVLSGMQPTGQLHIGNYLGALKNFVKLQEEYECYFMVADLHSLTENYLATHNRGQTLMLTATYLAAGVKQDNIFLQSLVPEHAELAWLLSTLTPLSELERMTQYKDKVLRQKQNVNAGLLTYPVLMAADVLLYRTDFVPVGDDQDQHLELTRTIARRFNQRFRHSSFKEDVFREPAALHTNAPRIMSLTDPTRKMSKSEPDGCLFLNDSADTVRDKITRAVTDAGPSATAKEMSPGVANLFVLLKEFDKDGKRYRHFKQAYEKETIRYAELKRELGSLVAHELSPYAELKRELGSLVAHELSPFQHEDAIFSKNDKQRDNRKKELAEILKRGSERARRVAKKTLVEAKERMGLSPTYERL